MNPGWTRTKDEATDCTETHRYGMKATVFVLLVALGAALCLAQAAPEKKADTNLMPNPGMEADKNKDGIPDGWAVDEQVFEKVGWLHPVKGRVFQEASKPKDGKFCLAYSSSGPDAKGLPDDKLFSFRAWKEYYRPGKIDTFTPIACSKVKVEKGKKYRLSAWTAAKDIPYLMIHLVHYDEDGRARGLGALLKPPGVEGISKSGTWDWEEWVLEWTPRKDGHMGFIPIIAENGPDRWVWIDKCAVELLEDGKKGAK